MTVKLCDGCRSLSLEFFLGEDNAAADDSSDDDSFEMITSSAYNTSCRRLEDGAANGCALCELIIGRMRNFPCFIASTQDEDDSKVTLVKVFDRYHRLAAHYQEYTFFLPIYSDLLSRCDEIYNEPPHQVHPLESITTLDLARTWLVKCDNQHFCTRRSTSIPSGQHLSMPTRLIDVGAFNNQNVRLASTEDDIDIWRGQKYMTLSHCWGSPSGTKQTDITTRANLEARKRAIDISELPNTFQDAIQITRQIGLRLLWIDSLCIIQDDDEDMDRECANMSSIYTCSYATIAASDSVDGHGGCFTPLHSSSNSSCIIPCKSTDGSRSTTVTIYGGCDEWISTIDGPLQGRGWVLQERHLSPRILHFTKSRLLFECLEWHSSADRPHMMPKKGEQQNQGALRLLRIRDGSYGEPGIFGTNIFDSRKWINIIEEYSQRSLSFSSDKLPALSGLANWFYSDVFTYAAGIWSTGFIKDLYWRPGYRVNEQTRIRLLSTEYTMPGRGPRVGMEISRSRIDGLPTWSWASMNCAIVYLGYDASDVVLSAKVLDFDIALAGINRYGAIKHARVRLSGLITRASALQMHGFKSHTDWYEAAALAQYSQVDARSLFNILVSDKTSTDTFRATFYIDVTDDKIAPDEQLLCLLTCNMARYYEPDDPDIAGLVLRDVGSGEWARVGTFQTRGAEIKWFQDERVLVLV